MEALSRFKIPINKRIDRILHPEYVSELVGTFFLVFTVCANVLQRIPPDVLARISSEELQRRSLGPLSIGSILMVMVFSTGGISGAHFNPAVTVAIYLTHPDKFPIDKAIRYIFVQCLGGLFAGLLGWWIMSSTFTLSPGKNRTAFDVMSVETFFAMALCFVVLNTATTKQDSNNQYFGLAIGFTVAAAAFGIGPVSGCAINPAVSFGCMLTHFFHTGKGLAYLIVYFGTPLIGSFAASFLTKVIRKAEFETSIAQLSSAVYAEVSPDSPKQAQLAN